jgi:uncharacterized protein YjbI with pentapeptide repeats
MADDDHIAQLKKGVVAWNAWLDENRNILPDLSGADLRGVDLREAHLIGKNLSRADLSVADLREVHLDWADLSGARLNGANLSGANLIKANLRGARLNGANLSGADLSHALLNGARLNGANVSGANFHEADLSVADLRANLNRADLSGARLNGANLSWADLSGARLNGANLSGANLSVADLRRVDLSGADLREANLREARLEGAQLVDTDFTDADLTGCRIFGISAWRLKLESAKQESLVITSENEPEITVDSIEVAQFIYLMLHNQKIRDVIDTIGKKAVLLLGRFTDERKAVLDALREELRKHNYLPILFDFDVPATRDITETVSLLARMARFIIADLTDPSSIPKELEAIVPHLAVPVQPLLQGVSRPFAMFKDYWKYDWVLPVYWYDGIELLLATLVDKVIAPAEGKVKALEERRRMIEAELTKPR